MNTLYNQHLQPGDANPSDTLLIDLRCDGRFRDIFLAHALKRWEADRNIVNSCIDRIDDLVDAAERPDAQEECARLRATRAEYDAVRRQLHAMPNRARLPQREWKGAPIADIMNYVTDADENGFLFCMPVKSDFRTGGDGLYSAVRADVRIESVDIYVSLEDDPDDGDLGVNYAPTTFDECKSGLIYTDQTFLADLQAWLRSRGFDEAAVADIEFSEHGMQGIHADVPRVSFDGAQFAAMLREMYGRAAA
ncbi:hypothetical protein [Falsiroseomonas sp. HW251]|uniref:hypothetical protein n=1 Tax=Falsiroseomonas sp. HW251 TaxID=3390998 RepID=UPI003D31BDEF